MKVLFQNRKDSFENWGGDTSQMVHTKTELEKLGVIINISLESAPDLNGYDLVHIFNIQTADYGIKQVLNAKKNKIPIVLSPIYWDKRHIENELEIYKYHRKKLIRILSTLGVSIVKFLLNTFFSKNRREINVSAKKMLTYSDLILPNSYAESECLALIYDLPCLRVKSIFVPNGIDKDLLSKPVVEKKLKVPDDFILQVGRIEPVKGQLSVIKAMMSSPEIALVFVGRGLDSLYGRECKDFGNIRGNVFFIEHIANDEINNVYKRAKVHVLPSLRESPGLVTLEAAVNDVNCVVSIHAPTAEYFKEDVWYCDPKKISTIEHAIKEAYKTPVHKKFKDRILHEFTWEKAASITYDSYKLLLENKIRNLCTQ